MKNKYRIFTIVLIGLLALTACSNNLEETPATVESSQSSQTNQSEEAMSNHDDDIMETTNDAMTESSQEGDMADDDMMHDDSSMAEDNDVMIETADLPSWQQIELTDARTGETFTLADFAGRPVFVEPMATWCTNCRRQLGNVRDARAQLGDDGPVFIGLSLETNISDAELAQYQADWGFDWTFAVMTTELLQQLADTFGRSITSAPSTPHFIIRPDGTFTDLVTGIESADQISQQLQAVNG